MEVLAVFLPLAGAILAGLFGKQIGRAGAHWVTILGVGAATVLVGMRRSEYVDDALAALEWKPDIDAQAVYEAAQKVEPPSDD